MYISVILVIELVIGKTILFKAAFLHISIRPVP